MEESDDDENTLTLFRLDGSEIEGLCSFKLVGTRELGQQGSTLEDDNVDVARGDADRATAPDFEGENDDPRAPLLPDVTPHAALTDVDCKRTRKHMTNEPTAVMVEAS